MDTASITEELFCREELVLEELLRDSYYNRDATGEAVTPDEPETSNRVARGS
jgi:hypothetical protein